MRNTFLLVERRKDIDGQPRYYACVERVEQQAYNLKFLMQDKQIISATVRPSRIEASRAKKKLNDSYKAAGKYLEPKYW